MRIAAQSQGGWAKARSFEAPPVGLERISPVLIAKDHDARDLTTDGGLAYVPET